MFSHQGHHFHSNFKVGGLLEAAYGVSLDEKLLSARDVGPDEQIESRVFENNFDSREGLEFGADEGSEGEG